jgi:hypothetical protein
VDVGLDNDEEILVLPLPVSGHCSQPVCYRVVMGQVGVPWHLVTSGGIDESLKI